MEAYRGEDVVITLTNCADGIRMTVCDATLAHDDNNNFNVTFLLPALMDSARFTEDEYLVDMELWHDNDVTANGEDTNALMHVRLDHAIKHWWWLEITVCLE